MYQGKTQMAVAGLRPVRGFKAVMLVTLLAAGGTVALSSWAQPAGAQGGSPAATAPRHGMHHGPRGGGFGGPGLFMGGPEQVDRGVDRMLRGLEATDAQRSQIQQIARAAAADLRTQREAGRALHEQGLQLFAAPVVDARAVEDLRQMRVAQHDLASKRITQALLEVSAVLTPEQRAKLAVRAREREQRMKERMHERMTERGAERRGAASAPAR